MPAALIDRAWAPRRARAALPWLLAVTALHLAMLCALSRLRGPIPPRTLDAAPAVAYLRLLWPPARAAAALSPAAGPAAPMHPRPPERSRPARSLVAPGNVVAIPPASPSPSVSASLPAAVGAAPLDLRLPERAASAPPTLGTQVLNDPRVITRRDAGDRFAQMLGTDTTLHEERLADGTLRLRRGPDCVLLKDAASARLDPFSQTYAPTPRLASRC